MNDYEIIEIRRTALEIAMRTFGDNLPNFPPKDLLKASKKIEHYLISGKISE